MLLFFFFPLPVDYSPLMLSLVVRNVKPFSYNTSGFSSMSKRNMAWIAYTVDKKSQQEIATITTSYHPKHYVILETNIKNADGDFLFFGHTTHNGNIPNAIELHSSQDLAGKLVPQYLIPHPANQKPYYIPAEKLGDPIENSEQYLSQPSVKAKLDQQLPINKPKVEPSIQDVNNID